MPVPNIPFDELWNFALQYRMKSAPARAMTFAEWTENYDEAAAFARFVCDRNLETDLDEHVDGPLECRGDVDLRNEWTKFLEHLEQGGRSVTTIRDCHAGVCPCSRPEYPGDDHRCPTDPRSDAEIERADEAARYRPYELDEGTLVEWP